MSVKSDLPVVTSECVPRDDVVAGEIEEEQYAASVHSVAHGTNVPEVYDDPVTFFTRTYPTNGLKEVLEHVASRLTAAHEGRDSGRNGTVTLDTAFGGEKPTRRLQLITLQLGGMRFQILNSM
jgi:predicted AAA+ superfamily ATPase